jgi:leader peptidase (prepilin peptidase)/N-methyltransferase
MTGLQGVGAALLLGVFLAAVGGLMLIAIRVRTRTDFIPYGAYLSLGAIVVVLLGQY